MSLLTLTEYGHTNTSLLVGYVVPPLRAVFYCSLRFFPIVTHPKQNQIHLKLGNPATDTASHAEAKRDGGEGVWPLAAVPEPSLWPERERLWECFLVMTYSVVTKGESGLGKHSREMKR